MIKQRSAEYLAWFRFLHTEGLTPTARELIYRKICEKKITIAELFVISEFEFYELFPAFGTGELEHLTYQNFQATQTESIRKQFEDLYDDTFFIPYTHPCYPQRIKERLQAAAPSAFFARGHLPLVNNPSIAVLGSEEINAEEIKLTWRLCTYFARCGYNVISNHTWGVAEHAHKSALIADGTTVGIVPCGLSDFVVRTSIRKFGYEINSLWLSALPNERMSDAESINEHTKLIAAWSEAVIIVKSDHFKDQNTNARGLNEAGRFALDNGIPVFVPAKSTVGNYSLGNARLSRAGAKDFTHPKQIVNFIEKG